MSAPARAPAARVLCCITRPHPAAAEALISWAPQAEIAGVRGEDTAYWREIRSRWAGERDLVIIEQDIGIGEGTVASLEGCGEDWCCYAYPVFARGIRLTMGLGCTKISAALQRKVPPETVEQAFALCDGCEGRGCWWHLDRHVSECLRQAGFAPHVHGDVTHHHAYDLRSYLWPPLYAGDRSAAEVFGDDRPPRDVPAIGPLTPGEATAFAAELLARGQEAVAAQAPAMDSAALDGAEIRHAGNWAPPAPYRTDKVSQGYMDTYRLIAADLGPAARVCELGVLAGGSLATWQDLFPEGTVAGVDVDPSMRWPDGSVKVVAGQDDPALPGLLSEHADEWDLIVDDASHDGALTAAALEHLWPLVAPGGFYVIEDWFTGLPGYQGPCKSPAMLTLVQGLLERLHAVSDTEWVSFRYGMAVIRKKD